MSAGRREAAAAATLFLLQAFLLVHTARDKSDTVDEPLYLAVSVPQWLHLDLASHCETPALPRWGFGLALRLADPGLFDESEAVGRHPLWSRPPREMRRNLFAARLTTIAVTLAGGIFLWRAARTFGVGVGLVTYALWCVSPAILASGSLATLDAWVTALACVALWATLRLVEAPTVGRAAAVGAVLALAAASKTTGLGLLPVAGAAGAWAAMRASRRQGRPWPAAVLSTVGSLAAAFLVTLWAVYAFQFGSVDTARPCGTESGLAHAAAVRPIAFQRLDRGAPGAGPPRRAWPPRLSVRGAGIGMVVVLPRGAGPEDDGGGAASGRPAARGVDPLAPGRAVSWPSTWRSWPSRCCSSWS